MNLAFMISTAGIFRRASSAIQIQPEERDPLPRAKELSIAVADTGLLPVATQPESALSDPVQALRAIREDIGDCTRCPLHKQGRKQIVFGVGNPEADLMFIGEAPGADEDMQGEPFVGRSGQLLTNMIKAMGLQREDVYIANIIKCRPPGNRAPERDECETCSPFLMRQIDSHQAQGHRGSGSGRGEDAAGDQCSDVGAARQVV